MIVGYPYAAPRERAPVALLARERVAAMRSRQPATLLPTAVRHALDAHIAPQTRVLDLGMTWAPAVARLTMRYVGLTAPSASLRLARADGLACCPYIPDLPLPFDAETFDVVVALEAPHDAGALARLAAQARGVLPPGGVLLLGLCLAAAGGGACRPLGPAERVRRVPLADASRATFAVGATLAREGFAIRATARYAARAGLGAVTAAPTAIQRHLLVVAKLALDDAPASARLRSA